jgi:exosortase
MKSSCRLTAAPKEEVMDRSRVQSNWSVRVLLDGAALACLGVLATLPAWRDIWQIAARDEEASHVFLVPIVFLWLIWVRRQRLRHIPRVGQWIGPSMLLLGWVSYNVGDANLWQSVWHGGAILIVVGCALTIWGSRLLKQMLPAFLALLFLIPVPGRVRQRVAIPMQNATARVTADVFELAGVPLDRSGNLLTLNGQSVAVAEACNGLRMVFALTLVCYGFAFSNPLRFHARLLILAASPIAAIICNVVRLVPTVYIYGNYPEHTAEAFHSLSGWVMLFLAFFLLLGILRVLRWALIPVYRFTLAYD